MTDPLIAALGGILGGLIVAGAAFVYFVCAQRNRKVSP